MVIPTTRACRDALWQTNTPVEMHGRVFALQQGLGRAVVCLGTLFSALTVSALSTRFDQHATVAGGFIAMGLLNLAVAAVGRISVPTALMGNSLPPKKLI